MDRWPRLASRQMDTAALAECTRLPDTRGPEPPDAGTSGPADAWHGTHDVCQRQGNGVGRRLQTDRRADDRGGRNPAIRAASRPACFAKTPRVRFIRLTREAFPAARPSSAEPTWSRKPAWPPKNASNTALPVPRRRLDDRRSRCAPLAGRRRQAARAAVDHARRQQRRARAKTCFDIEPSALPTALSACGRSSGWPTERSARMAPGCSRPMTICPAAPATTRCRCRRSSRRRSWRWQHNYQLCVHAIGDRANREVLDLFERVFKKHNVNGADLRWRIEHAQHLDPADIPRFKQLGVIASMQANHATSDGPFVVARLGERRARLGRLCLAIAARRRGDCHQWDRRSASSRSIRSARFYASVTRKMASGMPFFPEQCMTRTEALRSYTRDAAYAAFEEVDKGTLTAGQAGRHRRFDWRSAKRPGR